MVASSILAAPTNKKSVPAYRLGSSDRGLLVALWFLAVHQVRAGGSRNLPLKWLGFAGMIGGCLRPGRPDPARLVAAAWPGAGESRRVLQPTIDHLTQVTRDEPKPLAA